MIKPSVVIFDLGKVLVDVDYNLAAWKVASCCKAPPTFTIFELARFLSHSSLLSRFETGLLRSKQFYQEIAAATGYSGTLEEFFHDFGDIFTPIEPMIEFQAVLRRRGIPTYIFSNTNEIAARQIRRSFPFFAGFDGYILSYEHGVMKPNAGLYDVVEHQCGRRGAEVLYLDDRPENIDAGATRGWQVILHESPDKSLAAASRLGLL
jgi:HAD superfamily hydrolase (TIGR01509 family)